jgi:hypothetical protein
LHSAALRLLPDGYFQQPKPRPHESLPVEAETIKQNECWAAVSRRRQLQWWRIIAEAVPASTSPALLACCPLELL